MGCGLVSGPSSLEHNTCRFGCCRAHSAGTSPEILPLAKIVDEITISLRGAKKTICKRLKGTGLRWKGWYAFHRGMATNLFELGVPVEVAALVLRNTPEVVRAHYLKLEQAGKKVDAMARLEQAFNALEDNARAPTHLGVQSTVP